MCQFYAGIVLFIGNPAVGICKNGHIAETGTFDELMARKEYFYALFTVSQ